MNSLGNGLFIAVSALFFMRFVGLTAAQVGVGMAIGGVCGIVAGVPMGKLSDKWGARRLVVGLLLAEAFAVFAYTHVQSFEAFVVVVCVVTFLDRGASAVRSALIGQALPSQVRVSGRAYVRSMTNIGMGLGAALAGIALHFDTRSAYVTAIIADAVSFLVAAILFRYIPGNGQIVSTEVMGGKDRRQPLRDMPYLLLSVVNMILTFRVGILQVALPIWVVFHTQAPRMVAAAAIVANSTIVVVSQVRVSRGIEDPRSAARACSYAGLLIAISCVVFGAMSGADTTTSAILALLATAMLTWGEMLSAAGGWLLSYELSDDRAMGVYQGVFSSGFAAGLLFAPVVVTQTAVQFGMAGWMVLGCLFLIAGVALVPITQWALVRQQSERVVQNV